MYDVHDTIANKSDDYLVDKNGDNSIQTNDFDPTNGGSTCFSPGALHITPTVTTTPHIGATPVSGPVSLGQTVTDVALVQGVGTLQPTGDVAFTVCGPFTTATACTTGDSTAMPLGDPSVPTSTTPDSATYTSNPFTPTVAGTYCFLGHYSGDTLYLAGSDSSTTRECFTVQAASPTLGTTAQYSTDGGSTLQQRRGQHGVDRQPGP